MAIQLKRDHAHPSLAGTDTVYACAQVRLVDGKQVRYQIAGAEWTQAVTPDIAKWLAAQPAPWKSQAGTAAMYAPCLIRPETAANQQMRVQVPGAEFNRPWGAEFIHNAPCSPTAIVIIDAAAGAKAADDKPDAFQPPDDDDLPETEADASDLDDDDEEEEEDEDDDEPSDKAPF